VASGRLDGLVKVWEAQSGREVARMTHESWVEAVAFSPDGRYVASGSQDGTARVWEVKTGREVARMTHESWVEAVEGVVYSVAFSPDGKYVVSGNGDGTAWVWEAQTGREVARMTHEDSVWDVAFSPDGKHVVSVSGDGTVLVWLWRAEDLIAEACRRLPRNLTLDEWQQYIGPEVPYHATCPGKPLPEKEIVRLWQTQSAQRQRTTLWGGEAFLLVLALVLGWQGWRRGEQARLRWLYGAALFASTALIAAWQMWNAWKEPTSILTDFVGLSLLIAMSTILIRSSGHASASGKVRLVLIGLFLLLEGYAGIVYASVIVKGEFPALPGAEWIWEGWIWLFSPVFRLKELPLSWIHFSMLWVQWLGAASLALLTGWSVLQVAQSLRGVIRRRQK